MFDVWSSMAAFEKFGKTLMPILHGLGLDPGQPQVMPIHKVIVPPKKVVAKKAAPKKKAKAAARGRKR